MKHDDSFLQMQQDVDDWIKEHGGYWPPLSMLASIMEETGEVAREINHLEGHKPKKEKRIKQKLGEELADLLFSVICVSNYYELDLLDEFKNVLKKYTNRDAERFPKAK